MLGAQLCSALQRSNLPEDQVMSFIGIEPLTLRRWLDGDIAPTGLRLNSLWHLLLFTGNQPKPQGMHDFSFYLGQLLAFRAITFEQAMEYCGVRTPQKVFPVLRGQNLPARPRTAHPIEQSSLTERAAESYRLLKHNHEATLIETMAEWEKRFGIRSASPAVHPPRDARSKQTQPTTSAPPPAPPVPASHPSGLTDNLRQTASLSDETLDLELAKTLAEAAVVLRYLLNESTPERRAQVRALVGDVFGLAMLANQFCSEDAQRTTNRRA